MEFVTADILQEALFIYNAVNDGWSVTKDKDGNYKFEKDKKQIDKKDMKNLETNKYNRKFIEQYLRINNKE